MIQPTEWWIQAVKQHTSEIGGDKSQAFAGGERAAQLLWQRGIQDPAMLAGFFNPDLYQPASPFDFGQEMIWAVERIQQAQTCEEKVAIWGDFDADGITATAVLWEGLGQFFMQHRTLSYYIPNRLTESHGLSIQGLDQLAKQGCSLIITCDTGSTNLEEIAYAQRLGMDVIVTDHHTLPLERPGVTAIINPRYLPSQHPLAHLSGVAVAYKLIEALYQSVPVPPQQPLEALLDLVAIGLIADLVNLTGDCRYLAQQGIERLKQSGQGQQARPGIAYLLELCKKNGDRPTDISFGLGPRINAVSRIQGDAHFCVELLTSRDSHRCRQLAQATELANTRRQALQKDVVYQVQQKLAQLDLSTTSAIVLADTQWSLGILGLVAGQIAQEYDRPTILLNIDTPDVTEPTADGTPPLLARGSARSVQQIDLYQLFQTQAHLLHRFGGHPLAAGLSLPVENIDCFTDALNRQLRQQGFKPEDAASPNLAADLAVTVAELGRDLFKELNLLEPYGMGNPTPKLLIQNCWFENVWNKNLKDWKGNKVQYIKTTLEIWDDSTQMGFPGVWWGHYKEEVPQGRCSAVVELDFNAYSKKYEIRLIQVHPSIQAAQPSRVGTLTEGAIAGILDWRSNGRDSQDWVPDQPAPLCLQQCPTCWTDLQVWVRQASQQNQPLAIAYAAPRFTPQQVWQHLIGIAKYLSRTGQTATMRQLYEKLEISAQTLQLGLQLLNLVGFEVTPFASDGQTLQISGHLEMDLSAGAITPQLTAFLAAVSEEQFRQQYFCQVPLSTIQAMAR
ncbi:MAG: single-stranded-DNA-specific exonuclease RecJ [Leptolyngbyaceae bacterium]|nr:single-stranded-DNA-specific exonuclease RecJ [Leptolyngbyaceae bacterium]